MTEQHEANHQLKTAIETQLQSFQHETLQRDLIALHAVKNIEITDSTVEITLQLPFLWENGFQALQTALNAPLSALSQRSVQWHLQYQIATLARPNGKPAVPKVKNIIAVSSGKGGVGKSSTAVNVAIALQQLGASVGLLDADIYGPSIPTMIGKEGEPILSPDNQHMGPVLAHGLVTNSIGYLVEPGGAMIWRGPMASKALLQMLNDTLWPELDYLVIDMPPGTGDIQLTLGQSIPVTGAVIVTTPQDIALIDVKKGLTLFEKVGVPVIGIIENMSYHLCTQCGAHDPIFGEAGAVQLAAEYNTHCLAQIPLNRTLREDLDQGIPTVARHPDSTMAKLYRDLAERISVDLYWQSKTVPAEIAIKQL